MMRLGICAALNVGTTLHARSFLRGVYLATQMYSNVRQARHFYFDDGACAQGGRAAAKAFIDARVDVVIGHFASESAAAVVQSYAQLEIPLILPASTCKALTEEGATTFRICASDQLLANRLLAFARSQGLCRLALFADASLHGQQQRRELELAAKLSTVQIVETACEADALVFCGRLNSSRQFLVQSRICGCALPLLFTDDAASPALTQGLSVTGEVYVVSFPVAGDIAQAHSVDRVYQRIYGESAPVYALETVAAFSLVEMAATRRGAVLDALRMKTFPTPLGAVSFSDGENDNARVSLWIYRDDQPPERRLLS